MLATSRFGIVERSVPHDKRRIAVGLAVVAAHVVFVLVLGKGARQAPELVQITFFPLPITPEERPSPRQTAESPVAPRENSRRPRKDTLTQPAPITLNAEPIAAPEAIVPDVPAAPIDWTAELQASSEALQKRADTAGERRSFTAPSAPSSMVPRYVKPPCPFEQCEPTWGADFSVFADQGAKKGRIEKNTEGETIRWINEYCYQILITPQIMHNAMTMCKQPLKRNAARGDLFKHMRDVPPPEEKATDVP